MKKRTYATVERYLWKDPEFRALADSVKLTWLYLLTSPKTTICPGLIEISELTAMEDLGWDRHGTLEWGVKESMGQGLNMITEAFEALCGLRNSRGEPWLFYDKHQRLVVLPGAVSHNLPRNQNVVIHWLRGLQEIPECEGKSLWIAAAYRAVRRAYGTDDPRTQAIHQVYWGDKHRKGDGSIPIDGEQHGTIEQKETNTQTNTQTNNSTAAEHSRDDRDLGYPPDKNAAKNGDGSISINGKQHGTIKQKETNTQTNTQTNAKQGRNIPAPNNNSNNNTNSSNNRCESILKSNEHTSSNQVLLQGTEFLGDPAQCQTPEKPEDPPEDFTPRQVQVWDAMRSAVFYLPSVGELTAWEAVTDPVDVARRLGGEAYPVVDVNLIHRLANWTTANKAKGKKDVARFLYNRFHASQERGGDYRRGKGGTEESGYVYGGDLEEKKRKAK